MTILFENVQMLCKSEDMKLAQLERDAGVPEDSLQNWKTERRWMVQLPAVARQLNVSIDCLFQKDLNSGMQKEALLTYLRSLDYDTLAVVVEMAKDLKTKDWGDKIESN